MSELDLRPLKFRLLPFATDMRDMVRPRSTVGSVNDNNQWANMFGSCAVFAEERKRMAMCASDCDDRNPNAIALRANDAAVHGSTINP